MPFRRQFLIAAVSTIPFAAAFSTALTTAFISSLASAQEKAGASPTQKFPDVVAVKVRAAAAGSFYFDVTVSSPYDTPQRYADGIRVRGLQGPTYAVRKLWHDHADEQPFTREVQRVMVPAGVKRVVVEARDQTHGWGGKTVELELPGR